ncbi:MAG: cation:proton antiporter subunit C [Lachnospiraceae bacterium]|nr:cation:proton antiporter subunit C [Lachnospiraceae bacterium]
MFSGLIHNFYETAAIIVFGIGFVTLLLNRNIIKKIIGFNFMDTAIYLFLASKGYISGRMAPILYKEATPTLTKYINPVPAGLVLTGIVVSVSFTAFFLAIAVRLYREYHTLDLHEIVSIMNKEENEE